MVEPKRIAREIFHRTLAAIDIPAVIQRKIQCMNDCLILPDTSVPLTGISKVRVIAIGKAAHEMLYGFWRALPDEIVLTGIVAAPTKPQKTIPGFTYFVSGHPVPDQQSWNAAEAILQLLQSCDEKTLVIFLLSGGGSALSELSLASSMPLADVQAVHSVLVSCGAPIESINTIRKHLSAVKGGRLAAAAPRAKKITLAVSDVPFGKESALASGPTLPDPTTVDDVARILSEFDLRKKLPPSVLRWMDDSQMPETPKPGDPAFDDSHFYLLLNMDDLFHAAHHAAEAHGYVTRCDNSTDDWPVQKAADSLLAQLAEWRFENPGQRVALIADGEVSSPVTGRGVGGRNSALVLACVEKIAGKRITVLSAGTDGVDGNSPAAGAVADGETLSRARAARLDPAEAFRDSDAYSFFNKLEDAVITGPTGNNLRDLRIFLAEP
jgi:glycerate 2-kinase